jgi:thiol:disulfide interchange protein DsbC
MRVSINMLISCLVLSSAMVAQAGVKEIQDNMSKTLPGLQVLSVEESEIEGVYRIVASSGEVLFSNGDATYFLSGQLFSAKGGNVVNLTEQRKGAERAEKLAAIKPEDKITYPAVGVQKAAVTVFTDIDCGYCRKLHREVPRMNELGIQVSYVAYPRAGLGSESYKKIVSAWCSEDRLKAMTDAKAGKSIPELRCDNPVAEQFALGGALGVTGTPAIMLSDGTLVPGYVPADKLAKGLGIL